MSLGVLALWRAPEPTLRTALLAATAAVPLPAAWLGERYAIQRELAVVPLIALIGTFGAMFLIRQSQKSVRVLGVLLLLAMPLQFLRFYDDYSGPYRLRSAFALDPANVRGIAEYLIRTESSHQAPHIYLSDDLDDIAARWRFHLIKNGREDMLSRTTLANGRALDLQSVAAGSMIVMYASDRAVPMLLASGGCSVATYVDDVAGRQAAVILRKVS